MQGPLPAKLISRYLILGRIERSTRVSRNQLDWRPVLDYPELIPQGLLSDDSGVFAQERLEAARRWEDERSTDDRRHRDHARDSACDRRDGGDRRRTERKETARSRPYGAMDPDAEKRRERRFVVFTMVAIALLVGGITSIAINEAWVSAPGLRDCNVGPAPGVQWSHCSRRGAILTEARLIDAAMMSMDLTSAALQAADLTRANMSYATLVGATLAGAILDNATMVGTDLREADLTGASLHGTNLSYADLRDADITDADFAGAVLDRAIWRDGRICGDQSRGECRQSDTAPETNPETNH